MTDFETHPACTADLVKRLRSYEGYGFETTACYNGLREEAAVIIDQAADRIEQLEAAIKLKNIHIEMIDMAWDQTREALSRANAATAAAYEVAGKALDAVAEQWSCGHPAMHCDCARDIEQWEFAAAEVRGLATPDQTAALDKLIAEAEARVTQRIAVVCADAILAARKEHRMSFTNENYKAANIALGGLRNVAAAIDPTTFGLGNEEAAAILAASKKGGV